MPTVALSIHERHESLAGRGYIVRGLHPNRLGVFTHWSLTLDGLEVARHKGTGYAAIERFHDIVEGVAWQ